MSSTRTNNVYVNGIYKHERSSTRWVLYRDVFNNARLVPLHIMIDANTDEQLFMGGYSASKCKTNRRFIGFNSFGEDSIFDTPVGSFTIADLKFTGTALVGQEYLSKVETAARQLELIQCKAKNFFYLENA